MTFCVEWIVSCDLCVKWIVSCDCHVTLSLAAPHSRYTHWKQTVFYLQDCLTVQKGEKLTGTFSVKQNASNKVRMGGGAMVSV